MTTSTGPDLLDVPDDYEVTSSAIEFRSGRVIDVRTDKVRMPDGEIVPRDVVVHPGAVGVIALDDEERVLLLRQYRHPVRRRLWEPPAGLLDEPGEDPLAAAKRELYEEAHFQASRWDVLADIYTSPGMTDEAARIFLARDVEAATAERYAGSHEESDLEVAWFALPTAVSAVLAGQVHNPLAVTGLLAAEAARGAGFRQLRPADAPWPEMSSFTGSSQADL